MVRSLLAVAILTGSAVTVTAGPAAADINTSASALDIAKAMAVDPSLVSDAVFVTKPPLLSPDAVSTTALASFPTDGTSFGLLTNGDARLASLPNASPSAGTNDGGGNVRGNTDFDVTILRMGVDVPAGNNCLRFDYRFLSEEYPESIGSAFNDAFLAELDTSDWKTTNSAISAPHNFAVDGAGAPISVNTVGAGEMTAAQASGTTYDGATQILTAQTGAASGHHNLYLSIFDQAGPGPVDSHHIYDSAVFLDRLATGILVSGHCHVGGPPASSLALTVTPATAPAGYAQIPTSELDPAALTPSGGSVRSSLATAPIGHSPIGHSPIGHSPIGHSPIGHSPLGPDSPLRMASLAQLPLDRMPAIPLSSVGVSGTWADRLAGTSLANQPVQVATLQDVAALTPIPVSLGDVDLDGTVLQSLSAAAVLFGRATLGELGLAPPQGFSASSTLIEVELAGATLPAAAGVTLKNTTLSNAPLASFALDGIDLAKTPVGAVPVSSAADLVDCTGAFTCPAGSTLAQAEQAGALTSGATVSQLLAHADASIAGLTTAQLMPGILDAAFYPYERVPMDEILAAAPLDGPFVTYTASLLAACDVAPLLALTVKLPSGGFRYRPGTATFAFTKDGQPSGTAPGGAPTASPDGLTWQIPSGACSGGQTTGGVSLSFQAQPGTTLGPTTSALTVSGGPEYSLSIDHAAPLTLTENLEPNETPAQAVTISPNVLYPVTISSATDRDYFTIPAAQLPEGATVRVSFSHVPADFDEVILGPASSSSLGTAPIGHSPLGHSPIGHSPIGHSPLSDSASCLPDSGVVQPQNLDDVPVPAADDGLAVRGYSTNRGTENEVACTITSGGEDLTIQLSGFLGQSSPVAGLLDVQVAEAPPAPACPARSLSTGPTGTLPALPLADPPNAPIQTLLLWNQQRFASLYGAQAATDMLASLQSFAGRSDVAGVVLPVDGNADVQSAYQALDASPCSPQAANAVVGAIIDHVVAPARQNLSGLRFIQIVGGDDVVPFARIREIVPVGSESEQAGDVLFTAPDGELRDNPTAAALRLGNVLSDDWYASFSPLPFLGTQLPLPSVATARLVETPGEIQAQLTQFATFGGALNPTTEATLGTDFMTDGAQAVETALHGTASQPGRYAQTSPNRSRIDDSWTRSDFLAALASGAGILSPNAHFDSYRLLPGAFSSGSVAPTALDLAYASDLAGGSIPAGALLFTMGCHAGLNVPDVYFQGTDPRLLDWAQASARRKDQWLGGTGFGYGDTTVVAYTEQLMTLFAQNLDGSMTVGQAAALAKQQYVAQSATLGGIDAKVLEQATLYGLAMYRVGQNGAVASASKPAGARAASASSPSIQTDPATGLASATVQLSNLSDPAAPAVTPNGTYFRGPGGRTSAQPARPIEPVSGPVNLTTGTAGLRLHGAVVTSFTVARPALLNFDPVFSPATVGPQADQAEPLVADGSFPSGLVTTTAVDAITGPMDTLSMYGGWFTSDPSAPGRGTQNLILSADLTAYYSTSADYTAATVSSVEANDLGSAVTFTVRTPATDVAEMLITYRLLGDDMFRSIRLSSAVPGRWNGTLVTGSDVAEYFAQWVTANGATGASTFKALLYVPDPPPVTPGGVTVSVRDSGGQPVSPGAGGWYTQSPLTVSVQKSGESFTASVNGGAPQDASGGVTLTGDGVHRIDYTGDRGDAGTTVVPVDVAAPTVSTTIGQPTYQAGSTTWISSLTPITVLAADAGSGIASCSISVSSGGSTALTPACGAHGNTFTLPSSLPEGQYTVNAQASDQIGRTAPASTPVSLDHTPPSLTCPPSTTYAAGSGTKTVTATASDGGSGLDQAASTLSGTIDTNVPGPKTLTFVAKDHAGNTATTSCSFAVAYTWTGFFSPIVNGSVNQVNAGSTEPVKWRITNANGVAVSDPASFVALVSVPTKSSCGGPGAVTELSAGTPDLSYTGDGYWQLNWKTPPGYIGLCRTIVLMLADGIEPTLGGPRTAKIQFK